LKGVWLGMKHEIPQMLEQGGGVIVNMSSVFGKVGFANACAEVAANHGVLGLTKTAALEYAPRGIRVNAVCPSFILTPMLEKNGIQEGTDLYQIFSGLQPLKRMGTPKEVAETVVWLCSTAATYVTGAVLPVDGGYLAQ
jgi:NAD(P)-dependent dehydrogenase (short-subunit alcohol dehydrogenase family)